MDFLLNPWPWYIGGPMIALVLFLLLIGGKTFGMSSNLRTLCTLCGADKSAEFFNFNWKEQKWNLWVAVGTILGGYLAAEFLTTDAVVAISAETVAKLKALGIESAGSAYLPTEFFELDALMNLKTLGILAAGGFLIGFGTRYAGGCTSGHAITGLSNLQLPSLIAVIGFFIGGLLMNHFILPYLL